MTTYAITETIIKKRRRISFYTSYIVSYSKQLISFQLHSSSMHLSRILSVGGAALSVIPIALGIVAVATRIWLRTRRVTDGAILFTYGLFHVNTPLGLGEFDYPISQGLIIAGVIAIAVGVAITLLLDIVTKNRWIHLFPQIFLFSGPTLIFIGLLLYAKRVFEAVSVFSGNPTTLVLGYSIILAIIACLFGFLVAVYFAFVAGTRHSKNQVFQRPIRPIPIVYDQAERF